MSSNPVSPAAKQYEDGLEVHNADNGLYVHNSDDGLHVDHNPPISPHPLEKEAKAHLQQHNVKTQRIPQTPQTKQEVEGNDRFGANPEKRRKLRRIWIAVGVLLLLAVVLGAGLGAGLKHSSSNNTSSGTSSGGSDGSQPSSAGEGGALASSSLAAVMTSDNNRWLFYQNSNGSIDSSIFSLGSWKSSTIVSSARNNTPISAVLLGDDIMLLFADETSTLKYSIYGQSGTWSESNSIPYTISNTSTSVSLTPVTCTDSSSGVVLLYEGSSRVGGAYGSATDLTNIAWEDFSSNLTGNMWNTLGSPITTANSYLDGGKTLNAFFYNRQSATDTSASILREVPFSNFTTCHISSGSNETTSNLSDDLHGLTSENDLITFPLLQYPWYVINGSLASVDGPGGLQALSTQFPYTRLATINATTSTNIYLYNQLNQTTFLEHVAQDRGTWTTNTFSIPSD